MNFDQAFEGLLGHEGGYSNNPLDPGGETMWGITLKVARANGYLGPMKDMPVEVAKAIYRKLYWDTIKAEQLPLAVRYAVFDAAVNSGPEQAIKWLQRAVGVQADGKLGPITLATVLLFPAQVVEAKMLGHRLMFMTDLAHWKTFSRGWAKRLAKILLED